MQKRSKGGRDVDNNHQHNHDNNNHNHNNKNNNSSSNALVELVVGDASSPTRTDRGMTSPSSSFDYRSTTTPTTTADAADNDEDIGNRGGAVEYACNLIDTRPVSALGPKIHSVISGLLSPSPQLSSSSSSSSTSLLRYVRRRNHHHSHPHHPHSHQQPHERQRSLVIASHEDTPTSSIDFEYIDITNTRSSNSHQVTLLLTSIQSYPLPKIHNPNIFAQISLPKFLMKYCRNMAVTIRPMTMLTMQKTINCGWSLFAQPAPR